MKATIKGIEIEGTPEEIIKCIQMYSNIKDNENTSHRQSVDNLNNYEFLTCKSRSDPNTAVFAPYNKEYEDCL